MWLFLLTFPHQTQPSSFHCCADMLDPPIALSKCQQDEYCEFEKFMWPGNVGIVSLCPQHQEGIYWLFKQKKEGIYWLLLLDPKKSSASWSINAPNHDLAVTWKFWTSIQLVASTQRERERRQQGSGLSLSCADISLRCRIRTIAFFFLACCFQRFSARFIKNVVTFPKTKKKRRDFS